MCPTPGSRGRGKLNGSSRHDCEQVKGKAGMTHVAVREESGIGRRRAWLSRQEGAGMMDEGMSNRHGCKACPLQIQPVRTSST